MANKNFKVKNSISIPEPLAITEGGTGQNSATNSINALLPVQTSAANKFLQSDGTAISWVANVAYQRGGTAARPGSPTVGDLYYNTDNNYFESYTSNGWFPIAAAPGVPTAVVATNQGTSRTYNNGQASVAFTPNTGGGAASSFTLTPTPATSPTTFTGGSSPIVATGLASSTSYTYTVSATSPYGTSAASSASTGVTATTKPQTPTISVVASSSTTATVSITSASGGETATYSISTSPVTTTQTTQSSSYLFTGLTAVTSYAFTVTAANTNGTSAASNSVSITTPSADSGAMFPIAMVQVGSAGQAYVDFTSIPSTYTHLQVRMIAKSQRVNSYGSTVWAYFNGDYAPSNPTNYNFHSLSGDGASATSAAYTNTNVGYGAYAGGAMGTSATNNVTTSIIDILDYKNTSKNKTVRTLMGEDTNGAGQITLFSSLWQNTAAITSIRFYPDNYNFAQYTSIALYGIKGA
jgi:hypothetical protein